jgi:hypothetical protein
MNLCTKYWCKSLNKQPSGVQERINPFCIDSYGKNDFSLWTFWVINGLQERIKFMNRGSTVLLHKITMYRDIPISHNRYYKIYVETKHEEDSFALFLRVLYTHETELLFY